MDRKQIHKVIASLACSQGFYGRVMNRNYGDYHEILAWLDNTVTPREPLDIVFALEG